MAQRKLAVIGLDCAPPQFVFDDDRFDLPALRGLMREGRFGVLRSCDPPITAPAWQVMCSGRDPGALGCYGFRNRADRSYAPMRVATANAIAEPRIWDRLGDAGFDSIVLGVPQTWPPSPIRGNLVSGLLTPDTSAEYTHPSTLAEEIRSACGGYRIDVADFRTRDRRTLIYDLHELMQNRFEIARYLLRTKPWDFFMMVEIGLDRLHHAFWRFADPEHPYYEPDHRHWDDFRNYYETLDSEIARLLRLIPRDAGVLVASDHGATAIQGAIRINQWLIDSGYLALKPEHPKNAPLDWSKVDWPRTRAWSAGGYYARIFLNVAGREPEGVIDPEDYESEREQLAGAIRAIRGPNDEALDSSAYRPEALYPDVKGVPPDLLVYFDNFRYRAAGTVRADGIYADANDTGPDDANHAMNGLYIFRASPNGTTGRKNASILDVAPTVLDWFGEFDPQEFPGRSLIDPE